MNGRSRILIQTKVISESSNIKENHNSAIQQVENGVNVRFYIQTKASKTEIVGSYRDGIKLRVQAQPIDGKANEAIIQFFSKLLRVAKSEIKIVHGDLSKSKIIFLPLKYEEAIKLLVR